VISVIPEETNAVPTVESTPRIDLPPRSNGAANPDRSLPPLPPHGSGFPAPDVYLNKPQTDYPANCIGPIEHGHDYQTDVNAPGVSFEQTAN